MILPQVQGHEEASWWGQRLLDLFQQPFEVNQEKLSLSASVGFVLAPYHGAQVETLLQKLELAVSEAKHKGKGTALVYNSSSQEDLASRLIMESELQAALEKQEFVLYYQPQLDLKSNQVSSVEALVRWQHPQRGLITPGQFIGVLEDMGLLPRLSQWVLETACSQQQEWQRQGLPPLRIAVNISPVEFKSPSFAQEIQAIVKKIGIDPHYLDLEITEESTVNNMHHTVEQLQALKAQGIQVSLDDFGKGYSSLNTLKHFPLHTLKIDRTFITDLPHSTHDAAIVKTIVALGEGLDLQVLAEGVETLEQLEFLSLINCSLVQGYFISRPLTSDALEQWLQHCGNAPKFLLEQFAPLTIVPSETTTDSPSCPGEDISPHIVELIVKASSSLPYEDFCIEHPEEIGALKRELQNWLRQEQSLNDIAQKIRQSLDLKEILTMTVEEIRHLLDTDRTLLFQFDEDWNGQVVKESVAVGYSSILGEKFHDPCFRSRYVDSYRQGRFQAVNDINTAGLVKCHRDMLAQFQVRANLVMPIVYRNKLWGLLIAHHCRSTRNWQPHEIQLLNRLATQVAIAISQGELYHNLNQANQKLTRLATMDGLTQVANRYHFDQSLQQEWLRAKRNQEELGLILVDVDWFKQFNDLYGHRAGDHCLQQVAQVLDEGAKRPGDLVARYGGEEFVVLLPQTPKMGVWTVAEHLRQGVEALQIAHATSNYGVITVSLGITCHLVDDSLSPEELIHRADLALYRAKDQGRNCVCY